LKLQFSQSFGDQLEKPPLLPWQLSKRDKFNKDCRDYPIQQDSIIFWGQHAGSDVP
jgi:hypothetical protein